MDWVLNLTANGFEDLDTQLPELIASIVEAGGWIMASAINAEGAVHTRFEFERKDCVEIYSAMMGAGLELSRNSHAQLAQLAHCTPSGTTEACREASQSGRNRPPGNAGSALVELSILPLQIENFDRLPEQPPTPEALIGTSSS